jgi:hypothetical protein
VAVPAIPELASRGFPELAPRSGHPGHHGVANRVAIANPRAGIPEWAQRAAIPDHLSVLFHAGADHLRVLSGPSIT